MNLTYDMFKLLGDLSLIDDKEKLNNEFRHLMKLPKSQLQEMQMYLYGTRKANGTKEVLVSNIISMFKKNIDSCYIRNIKFKPMNISNINL